MPIFNKSASRLVERELLPHLRNCVKDMCSFSSAQKLIAAFTPPKPSIKKRAAKKKKKDIASGERDAHGLETSAIYLAVEKRAGGFCECGCGRVLDKEGYGRSPELDHFHGRQKVRQSVENTWMLARYCHVFKGDNNPSRAEWDLRFKLHCERYGYVFRQRLVKSALSVGQ